MRPVVGRVLCDDDGDGGHAITTQGREGLEVSLDPGPSAAVGAGNGEHSGVLEAEGVSDHFIALSVNVRG